MTQHAFAKALRVSQGWVCMLEKGQRMPSVTLMLRIEKLFGYRPDLPMTNVASEILRHIPEIKPRSRRRSRRVAASNRAVVADTPAHAAPSA